jgi:Cys-tRNA(Pro)/Cys-tRNA(Cys) deacylase
VDEYEEKLRKFMHDNSINAEHLSFRESCHTVKEAAKAAKADASNLVKSICMVSDDKLLVAIVCGVDRASTSRIEKTLSIGRLRILPPVEILRRTGYPCGGTPPFGYDSIFLIDPKVMEKEYVYAGGGSEKSLVKLTPVELQKANKGRIVRIGK